MYCMISEHRRSCMIRPIVGMTLRILIYPVHPESEYGFPARGLSRTPVRSRGVFEACTAAPENGESGAPSENRLRFRTYHINCIRRHPSSLPSDHTPDHRCTPRKAWIV